MYARRRDVAQDPWSLPRVATVTGLTVGALGIAMLWASGVEFPIYPPPGLVILLVGALFVGLAWPWAPGVGAFMGLFVIVGFLLSSLISGAGVDNLTGEAGVGPSVGSAIQLIGVFTALVAGVIATRDNYRQPASR